ncbi:hypothetical protein [Taibaiella koreensis]|uniref:hypothetical protein n=1 Tax=Taibaiella koreensis TaxID=1268548 RepID=UPI000E5A04C7|nr:hypothetical protein [Taibaiella koreensis]
MKKLKFLLPLVLLSACSKDSPEALSIVGIWDADDINQGFTSREFTKDGKYSVLLVGIPKPVEGTYQYLYQEQKLITSIFESGFGLVGDTLACSVSGDKLQISNKYYYTRRK